MIFAYLDPGAGSMLIQAVIAGALTLPFFLKAHIRSVVDRLRRRRTDHASTTTTDRPAR